MATILDKKRRDPNYYILVHSKAIGSEIKTTAMCLRQPPPERMLGTMCFKVDNELCRCDRIWNLPLDVPIDESLIQAGVVDLEVANSAKGLPIIT